MGPPSPWLVFGGMLPSCWLVRAGGALLPLSRRSPALPPVAPVKLSALQGLSEEKLHVGEALGSASRVQ